METGGTPVDSQPSFPSYQSDDFLEPYPIEQEVELIAVLEAGKRSLQEGREVTIKEVLE